MTMIALSLIVVSIISLVIWLKLYRRRKLQLLHELGIPGPEPHWLLGNLGAFRKKPMNELIPEWTAKFGRVWGYYEGPKPTIVCSDPDMLQEIFVKQFSSLHGRKLFPLQPDPDTTPQVDMFTARGERWKRLRTTINPAFSEKRMRQMFPLVDGCVEVLLRKLDSKGKEDDVMDIYEHFQALTLDVICETAFGIEVKSQENPNHPFIKKLRNFFGSTIKRFSIFAVVGLTFPEIRQLVRVAVNIKNWIIGESNLKDLRKGIDAVVQTRRTSDTSGRVDLLQLMLDAEVKTNATPDNKAVTALKKDDFGGGDSASEDSGPKRLGPGARGATGPKSRLTKEEVTSQSLLFLFAGYETSSTALGYAAYHLATNESVQHRLLDEIDSAYEEMTEQIQHIGNPLFHEAIAKLPYLDAFINEVLRYRPFASLAVNRLCMKDGGVDVKGIHIPGGVNIMPDVHTLHFDPELWGPIDPKVFEPDRFLPVDGGEPPTRHPMAFFSFGAGPRVCIGQRLAMMEIKTCLARLLHNYSIQKCDKTPEVLPVRWGATIVPRDGVWIRLESRR